MRKDYKIYLIYKIKVFMLFIYNITNIVNVPAVLYFASAYLREIFENSYPLIVTRKARNNAALNFLDNICFALEVSERKIQKDKPIWLRNSAFDYDLKVLLSSETEELVLLDFSDISEERDVAINFSLSA